MKQILVKAYFNTDADGVWVYDKVESDEDLPICFFGPFDSIVDAIDWMENKYPDGDEDLYDMVADEFDLPEGSAINAPDSIYGDAAPDEDIRTESQEIHGS